MNTKKNIEKAGRQVWLAGLGAVLLGKEYAVKKLDEMFEGTNSLVNQVVTKGQEIEGDIKSKVSGSNPLKNSFIQDEKIAELREKLGLNQESKQDKISRLAAKVDALTDIVATISVRAEEEKAAAAKKSAPVKKATAATPAQTETTAAAPKAAATATAKKTTATRKPRATATKTTATKTAATASNTAPAETAAKKPATTRTRARKAPAAKATGANTTDSA